MSKFNNSQKGNMQLLVLIIIVFAALVGVYLVQQRTNFLPKAGFDQSTTYQSINSSGDLDKALNDVNSADLNQVDQGINQTGSDASSL
jgi:hypothetical protein